MPPVDAETLLQAQTRALQDTSLGADRINTCVLATWPVYSDCAGLSRMI